MEPPYKICCDESLGRHLVATRLIPRGTVILEESPLVRGPFFHTYPVCVGCGKLLTLDRPCGSCGWPVCDETCEHSSNHQPECLLTKQRGSNISIKNFGIPNPNYQFVTILRALSLKKSQPEAWKQLLTLQSHSIDVNLAPPSFVRQLFKLEDWSEEEILKVSQILVVNGHELPLTIPSQLVLYYKVSFFEHSCKANCTKTFTNKGNVVVVAAEDVQIGDHLSICYTDPLWGVDNRRRHLHQTKQFWCCCPRCKDPTDGGTHLNSLKCLKSSCLGVIHPRSFISVTNWFCTKCDASVSNDDISLLLEKIGVEVSQIAKTPEACKEFLLKYGPVLPETHFYIVDVKIGLSATLSENYESLNDDDLEMVSAITEELRSVVLKVAPAESRLLGLLYHRRAKSNVERARRRDVLSREVLQAAKADFQEAHRLLLHEPTLLPEGRTRLQITLNLKFIEDLLIKMK